MALGFRDSTFSLPNSASLVTAIAIPSGVIVNDRMLALIQSIGSTTGQTITDPPDWTKLGELTDGSNCKSALYYRDVTGTEAPSYSWTWTNSGRNGGLILAYKEVDISDPPVFTDQAAGGAAGNISTDAIAVPSGGWLVSLLAARSTVASPTISWANSDALDEERYDVQTVSTGNEVSLGAWDSDRALSPGSVSRTLTGTFSSGQARMVAWAVALSPISGDPGPSGPNPWSHVGVPHR